MIGFNPREMRYMPAAPNVRATGMLGWVTFDLGPVQIDSVSVRRRKDGSYHLSFPVRVDSNGAEHSLVRPLNASARAEIETAVLGELRKRGFIS